MQMLSRLLYPFSIFTLYVATASFVLTIWLATFRIHVPTLLEDASYGELLRPFAYRALVPFTIRSMLAPVDLRSRAEWSIDLLKMNNKVFLLTNYLKLKRHRILEYSLLVAMLLTCLVGFAFIFRKLFTLIYHNTGYRRDLVPALALLCLTPLHIGGGQIYDYPMLVLFCLALYAMAARKHFLYYLAISFGALNKETMCLIVFAFAFYNYDVMKKRTLAKHLVCQIVIFILWRLAILFMFDPVEPSHPDNNQIRNYLFHNLALFWNSKVFKNYSYLMTFLVFLLLVFRKFKEKPIFVRRAFILVVPFMLAYIYGGWWGEIRVFYEIYPILFLLAYHNYMDLVGSQLLVRTTDRDVESLDTQASWCMCIVYLFMSALFFLSIYGALLKFVWHDKV